MFTSYVNSNDRVFKLAHPISISSERHTILFILLNPFGNLRSIFAKIFYVIYDDLNKSYNFF